MKKILIMFFLLLSLSGCLQGDIDINYQNTKQAALQIKILLPSHIIKATNTSLDDFKDQLLSSYFRSWTIKQIDQSINGTVYQGYLLQGPDQINDLLLKYYKQNDNEYTFNITKKELNQMINQLKTPELDQFSFTSLQDYQVNLNLNIKLPGKITSTTFGNINDSQVTIDLLTFLNQNEIDNITIKAIDNYHHYNYILFFIIIIIVISLLKKARTTFF